LKKKISIKKILYKYNDELFIHPDLAIQLSSWISPIFSFYITKWIQKFNLNNTKIIEDQTKKIKLLNYKIKLFEKKYLKKQKRINYSEKNLIYILTTEYNENNRIYIIGKTQNLKNRLSVYNKSAEHKVIYYCECNNKAIMNTAELIILNKLENYKERVNRDRFVLPINKNINFFINIINESVNFLNKNEMTKEDIEIMLKSIKEDGF
jgi:hypothetical protein